jgi:hypothetical protein
VVENHKLRGFVVGSRSLDAHRSVGRGSPLVSPRLLLKREPLAPSASTSQPALRSTTESGERRFLACAQCLSQITTPGAAISVSGSHEHTFSNPEGLRFRIGCFASVTGCVAVGPRSTYWTWFPGHGWQVVVCGGCQIQLGWRFSGERRFHGLILDRLVELVADGGPGEPPG